MAVHLDLVEKVTPAQIGAVRQLAEAAAAHDGIPPLSEQFVLRLRPSSDARHVLAHADHHDQGPRLSGYAQLDDPGSTEPAAELVVHPAERRRGIGRALLERLPRHTRIWAHGRLPQAEAFAAACGLAPVRELHQLARPVGPDLPTLAQVRLPAELTHRPFRPATGDEADWVATNAAAFATHPEQGRLTATDLHERMAQPWFDPAGFLLVVPADANPPNRGPAIAAFHWTKIHPGDPTATDASAQPRGEVYVVGVHPAYQGRGLGRPVTLLGLAHLAARGVSEVFLYVDADNVAAWRTYHGLGFRSRAVDRMYARVNPGEVPLCPP